MRKTKLERLLARRPEGIFVNPFDRGEIGPDLFRAACRMGMFLARCRAERQPRASEPLALNDLNSGNAGLGSARANSLADLSRYCQLG
jgi:hypothetical protein